MKLPRDISPELADAIANLYHVFARYHLGGPVTGCPCCTSPADDALLRSKPLRVLSGDDLSRYAQKAITTLGSEVDLKHFLPRLLELAALEGNIGSTNLEIAMGKLVLAEFPRWPEVEKTAVEQFLRALWRQTIGRFPPDYDDTDYLCSIGCAVDDLTPFLNDWLVDTSGEAAVNFSRFVLNDCGQMFKHLKLANAFWNDVSMRSVLIWLANSAVVEYLEAAFFRFADQPFASEISAAQNYLEFLQIHIRKHDELRKS